MRARRLTCEKSCSLAAGFSRMKLGNISICRAKYHSKMHLQGKRWSDDYVAPIAT